MGISKEDKGTPWLADDEIARVKQAAAKFLEKKLGSSDNRSTYGTENGYSTPMESRLVANAENETKAAVNGLIDEMASDKVLAEGILNNSRDNRITLLSILSANNLAYRKFTGLNSEGKLQTSSVSADVRNAFENLVIQALDVGFKALPEEKRIATNIPETMGTKEFTDLVKGSRSHYHYLHR